MSSYGLKSTATLHEGGHSGTRLECEFLKTTHELLPVFTMCNTQCQLHKNGHLMFSLFLHINFRMALRVLRLICVRTYLRVDSLNNTTTSCCW